MRCVAKLPPIIVDTREQLPWSFAADVATMRAGLKTGDYSLFGFDDEIGIERKSPADFVMCCVQERPRFERELGRLAALDVGVVIVEASLEEIWLHEYRSRVLPQSVVGSIVAWTIDYGVPILLAGDRESAADLALRILRKFFERKLTARAA
jgi:ERCC4-type nuclease